MTADTVLHCDTSISLLDKVGVHLALIPVHRITQAALVPDWLYSANRYIFSSNQSDCTIWH